MSSGGGSSGSGSSGSSLSSGGGSLSSTLSNIGKSVWSGLTSGGSSSSGSKTIVDYQRDYNNAKARGDTAGMQAAHAGAEKLRANQGYSGGADGSQHISLIPQSSSSSSLGSSLSSNLSSSLLPNSGSNNYKNTYEDLTLTNDLNSLSKVSNEYGLGLLDPNNLPGFIDNNGTKFTLATAPTAGVSRSTDVVSPPTFDTDSHGNIIRTDHTYSGDVRSVIANTGGWTKTGSGTDDQEVGDTYYRQISPYAAEGRYVRGDRIGSTPSWYDPDATTSWLNKALDITKKNRDASSLIPSTDNYSSSLITGTTADNNNIIDRAKTPEGAEAELREYYGDVYVDSLSPADLQESIQQIMSGANNLI